MNTVHPKKKASLLGALKSRGSQQALHSIRHALIATILGLALGACILLLSGKNPISVYREMFHKSFFGLFYFFQTLTRATPIMMAALATIVAWRAGYINIGVEGQMIVGCFVSTTVVLLFPSDSLFIQIVAILIGMLAAALYALLATFLYHRFRVSLVICTLMMNYIANYIVSFYVNGPMKDPAGDSIAIQTAELPKALFFARLVDRQTLHTGFLIALCLVATVFFMGKRMRFGYESKLTGLNPVFAEYAGIRKVSVMYRTMALSGALAGLGGIIEVFGLSHRYVDNMITSNSYAWTGLMAALISALHPIGILLSSIFLAGLQVGGQSLQRTQSIPLQLSTIIQTSITLFVSIKLIRQTGSPLQRLFAQLKASLGFKKAEVASAVAELATEELNLEETDSEQVIPEKKEEGEV